MRFPTVWTLTLFALLVAACGRGEHGHSHNSHHSHGSSHDAHVHERSEVASEELLHTSHTYRQTLVAPRAKVFPLLCPVRELEWAPGWEAKVLHSKSGVAELGCIFTTQHPGHAETTWVVTRYEPLKRIDFSITEGNMFLSLLSIELSDAPGEQTYADITRTRSALTAKGNHAVEAFTEAAYEQQMKHWEQALNHFLREGTMIPSHH